MCLCVVQSALEIQAFDERDKAQRLQTELDVSEQVQKDFVKLSQTLQVGINSVYVLDRFSTCNAINASSNTAKL